MLILNINKDKKMLFCLVYALTNYRGFCVIPSSVLILPWYKMLSPKNVIFTDSLLPMKGFPQRVPLIFHYRITGGHRQILLYALHSRKLFSSFTFRFHTLRATYRCLCSELIYHDPGRLYGGNGEEMHLYTNQPYLHFFFIFLFYYFFIHKLVCNASVF